MRKVTTVVLALMLTAGISILALMANMGDKAFAAGIVTDGQADISFISEPEGSAELLPGAGAEKSFTIKNNGADAFVWLTYAVPDGLDGENGALSIAAQKGAGWKVGETTTETINGKQYTVYTLLYENVLAPNGETSDVKLTVSMASNIDIDEDGDWIRVENGNVTELDWNSEAAAPTVDITVWAGLKAGTVDTVDAAYTAAGSWDNATETTGE